MRPLTDDETKVLFEKLANYIGKNIEQLINRPDEKCCFRLHKDRVYYVRFVSCHFFPLPQHASLSCLPGISYMLIRSKRRPGITYQVPGITSTSSPMFC